MEDLLITLVTSSLLLSAPTNNVVPVKQPTVTLTWKNLNYSKAVNSNTVTTIEYSTNLHDWNKLVTLPYSTNCIVILSNRNPTTETYRVGNTYKR